MLVDGRDPAMTDAEGDISVNPGPVAQYHDMDGEVFHGWRKLQDELEADQERLAVQLKAS